MVRTTLIAFFIALAVNVSCNGPPVDGEQKKLHTTGEQKELRTAGEDGNTQFADRMIRAIIVPEFEAREVTLIEVCEKLNEILQRHQDDIGIPKATAITVVIDKDLEIAKRIVFLHVKHISLKTILSIICEQNYLIYVLEGDSIRFESSAVE